MPASRTNETGMSSPVFFNTTRDSTTGSFSNFNQRTFVYRDNHFRTSEHAFHWAKANLFGDSEICEAIMRAPTPKAAKEEGRRGIKDFKNEVWTAVRFSYMVDILKCKFEQHEDFKQQLLNTGERVIVEASKDNIWGIGFKLPRAKTIAQSKWGKNLLGRALMKVRKDLRDEESTK